MLDSSGGHKDTGTIVLITVSGSVGSGKSTLCNELTRRLTARGIPARSFGFQQLECFRLLRRGDRERTTSPGAAAAPAIRRTHYRRTPLTFVRTAIQLVRIISFRIYLRRWKNDEAIILNRYFYDSFSHFGLDGRAPTVYLRVLRYLIPVPDLAIVLQTDYDVLRERRPFYHDTYLKHAHQAYRELPEYFPGVLAMASNDETANTAERLVMERLSIA